MKKKRIFVRVFPFNVLTFPLILNVWETKGIDREFEIIIIDNRESLEKIKFTRYDVILYSFMTPFLPLIHSEVIKIKNSGVLIAAGGPHISGEQLLAKKMGFDILFVGPGEASFLRFGQDLLAGKCARKEIYRANIDKEDSNLNGYLPVSKYCKTIPPLEIMRGCFWKCKYCGTSLQPVHYRSLASIDLYLRQIKEKGIKRVNFISPSSLEYAAEKGRQVNTEILEEFLKLVQSYDFKFIEYGIFPSEIRPDTVSDEIMKVLKDHVSNRAITIGAQSFSNSRLKELARGHTITDIEKAAAIANRYDFLVNLDFIIGYPGESREEREFTIAAIKKLSGKYRIKTQLHFFFPLPGSSYAYRLPSFLSAGEKEKLMKLKKSGISKCGWISNERQVVEYLNWLKQHFPDIFDRYH